MIYSGENFDMIVCGSGEKEDMNTTIEIVDYDGPIYDKYFKNPRIAIQVANKLIIKYENDGDLDYEELESMGFIDMN